MPAWHFLGPSRPSHWYVFSVALPAYPDTPEEELDHAVQETVPEKSG